jgi:acyl-CoA thioesterase-1
MAAKDATGATMSHMAPKFPLRWLHAGALPTLIPILTLCLLAACGRQEAPAPAAPAPVAAAPAGPTPAAPPASAPQTAGPTIIFLGDSLTAGYGLETDQAFPALVAAALQAEGWQGKVVNAGVSGDTTAGGLQRTGWVLRQNPDILVVGLGGNDGLRGLDLAATEANLRAIVRKGKAAGAKVLLLGMQIPPNYGPAYTESFAAMFPRIAREEEVPLLPFLLEGVGGDAALNQADGIHPTIEGQKILARTVLAALRPLLAP